MWEQRKRHAQVRRPASAHALGVGGHGARVGQRHAERLDGRRHGVGRVHPAARAGPRARLLDDLQALLRARAAAAAAAAAAAIQVAARDGITLWVGTLFLRRVKRGARGAVAARAPAR